MNLKRGTGRNRWIVQATCPAIGQPDSTSSEIV